MNRNERHADLLQNAARHLRKVDVTSTRNFEDDLKACRAAAMAVWRETAQDPAYAASLRRFQSAISAVQSVLIASVGGRIIPASDGDMLANAASTFEELAADASERVSAVRLNTDDAVGSFSSVDELRDFVTSPRRETAAVKGSGYREPAERDRVAMQMERNLSALTDLTRDLSHLNALKAKLPRGVLSGRQFAMAKMPVVVSTGKPVNRSEMNRSGAKWVKQADESVVLFDQIVLGFEESPDLLDKSRKVKPGSAHTRTEPGLISTALHTVGMRAGRRVVGVQGVPYFRTPGNSLLWVWAAQPILVGILAPKRVTFPWNSTPSHADLQATTKSLQEELDRLERDAIEAVKIGRSLKDDQITRMSHLRERLDRDSGLLAKVKTPEERKAHVAALRAMAEAELRKQFGPLVADVEEQRLLIRDLPASDRPKAQRELQRMLKQLDAAREQVAQQLRNKV